MLRGVPRAARHRVAEGVSAAQSAADRVVLLGVPGCFRAGRPAKPRRAGPADPARAGRGEPGARRSAGRVRAGVLSMTRTTVASRTADLADMQGDILRAYGNAYGCTTYLFLSLPDAE